MTNRLQKIEKTINSMSDEKFNELLNDLGVKEDKQWVPEIGEPCWVIFNTGVVARVVWFGNFVDNYRLLMNNVFKTEEEAEAQRDFNIEKAKLIKEIEDSSDEIDWRDGEQSKYSLLYVYYGKEIRIDLCLQYATQGTTYTTNRVFLENLIENEPERVEKYLFGIGG